MSSFLNASSNYGTYKVPISDFATVPAKLPIDKVEAYRSDVIRAGNMIKDCKTGGGTFVNPFLDRSLSFAVKNSSAGCVVEIESYGSWEYNCRMSKSDRSDFSSSMLDRATTDLVLGDYSEGEKAVLFNKLVCDAERLRRK